MLKANYTLIRLLCAYGLLNMSVKFALNFKVIADKTV